MNVKAAVLYEPSTPLVVEEIEQEPPKAGEVRVRTGAAGLCRERPPRDARDSGPANARGPGSRGLWDRRGGRSRRNSGPARRQVHPLVRVQLRPLPHVPLGPPKPVRHQRRDWRQAVRRHRPPSHRRHGGPPDGEAGRVRRSHRHTSAGLPSDARRRTHGRGCPHRLLRGHGRRSGDQFARDEARRDGGCVRLRRRGPETPSRAQS